ncbi:MAG: winged helix-turn-helix transcriptional regulator [Thermoflexales bacterium]|nr:winged helix-turn-helix transcriptional regulator [Thermoflexales bacterium]
MMIEQSVYQDRAMAWLEPYGFTANPFTQCEASQESGLPKYFFDRFHDAIKGTSRAPQTCFVFAERGSGKTAQRVMIEKTCQPLDRSSDILAVPYVRFTETIEQAGGDIQQVRLEHHIQQIVTLGVRQLLQVLFQKPRIFLEMLPEDRETLAWFLANYGAAAWSPLLLLKLLRDWGAITPAVSSQHILQALEKRDIHNLLSDDLLEQPRGQMLARLVEMAPNPAFKTTSAVQLWSDFVSLAAASHCQAVYVLVDGIDELPETWDSPSTLANYIRPLTHNTTITEMPRVAFKFFLPADIEAEFDTVLRKGRFRAHKLAWSSQDLQAILGARLKYFSEDKYDSLGALAEADINAEIDTRIVEYAVGSPRRLMALGRDLIEQKVCAQDREGGDRESAITYQDLLAVLERSDIQEYGRAVPPLRLDLDKNIVLIGHRPVELAPQQFAVVRYLYEAKAEVKSKNDIARLLYPTAEGSKDQVAIDSLMWRIRRRMERDPKNPEYLITERGLGYRLQNVG